MGQPYPRKISRFGNQHPGKRSMVALMFALVVAACGDGPESRAPESADDSAFAALQERGSAPQGMGVDQYASVHRFDDLPDGGRIEFQDSVGDDKAVARIRAHLQEIVADFARGDFSTPGFVHAMEEVPGTRVMAERKDAIRFTYNPLSRGGEVRMETADTAAIRAIHEFLAFQRLDHRAMGHDMH
jgi:hypothetical protein